MVNSESKVLVTGASSGIGLATVKKMLTQGANVTGIARDFSGTEAVQMQQYQLDLAELDSLTQKLQTIQTSFDTLILNAGYGRFGGLEQFSHEQIRHLVDTNLISNMFIVKHYLPAMKQAGKGDIVLLGSESALSGARGGSVYCATKFALRGFAQSLRADCSNSGIRVLLINPGPVSSDFFDELAFEPHAGDQFVIDPEVVAETILHALQQPQTAVAEEINLQPIKRSFQKKKSS